LSVWVIRIGRLRASGSFQKNEEKVYALLWINLLGPLGEGFGHDHKQALAAQLPHAHGAESLPTMTLRPVPSKLPTSVRLLLPLVTSQKLT